MTVKELIEELKYLDGDKEAKYVDMSTDTHSINVVRNSSKYENGDCDCVGLYFID